VTVCSSMQVAAQRFDVLAELDRLQGRAQWEEDQVAHSARAGHQPADRHRDPHDLSQHGNVTLRELAETVICTATL
jgi:hypothetical protein